jgi:hypothetical protein
MGEIIHKYYYITTALLDELIALNSEEFPQVILTPQGSPPTTHTRHTLSSLFNPHYQNLLF